MVLADKIDGLLQEGIILGRKTTHYIDSTFLNPSFQELEAILIDESEPDRDALLELIFFPDENFQLHLESMLEKENFQKKDEKQIVSLLIKKKTATVVTFPDERKNLTITLPHHAACQLVARLNISKKTDTEILETINTHIESDCSKRVKVILRNSKLILTRRKAAFLCSFFKAIRSDECNYLQCLHFVLHVLSETEDHIPVFVTLVEKKRAYHQALRKAAQLEQQLAGNNMETLLMKGMRIPHISKEESRNRIEMIDRICLAVFRQTGYAEPDSTELNLGSFNKEYDINKLIEILS